MLSQGGVFALCMNMYSAPDVNLRKNNGEKKMMNN